jgi:hypothetical protein
MFDIIAQNGGITAAVGEQILGDMKASIGIDPLALEQERLRTSRTAAPRRHAGSRRARAAGHRQWRRAVHGVVYDLDEHYGLALGPAVTV